MNVKVNDIFIFEENKGKSLLQTKWSLHKAKKEGTLFFYGDVSSLTANETMNLYYYELCSSSNKEEKNAFPIPLKEYVLPSDDNERFLFLKKYYESYYPSSEMTYDTYKSFKLTPYITKKCVWFYQ